MGEPYQRSAPPVIRATRSRVRFVAARALVLVVERRAVALLELLPAAAGAEVVPADLRRLAAHRLLDDARRGLRLRRRLLFAALHLAAVTELHAPLLRAVTGRVLALHALDVRLALHLHLEELGADGGGHGRDHGHEDVV